MSNPWTKKNPLLSMWLSGANSVLGTARGHATAAAKRQAASVMTEGAKQAAAFWSGATPVTGAPKKRTRKKLR